MLSGQHRSQDPPGEDAQASLPGSRPDALEVSTLEEGEQEVDGALMKLHLSLDVA